MPTNAMFDKYGNLLVGQGSAQSGSLPYLSLPPGWDQGWIAAKAASASAAQWLTVIADSISDGQNCDDYVAHGWVSLLKAALIGRGYSLMGDFWMPTASVDYTAGFQGTPPFVVTSTGRSWLSWGYGRLPFYSAGNGTITFTCPYACTELDVVFFDQTAGTFTYNLDAAGAVTVVPNCTGVHYHRRLQLTGLSNIAHSIVFTTQSGGNVMAIQGVATYPTAAARSAGIGFGRCAYEAAAAADFGLSSSQPADMCAVWQGKGASTVGFGFPTQPQLAVLELGVNDCANLYGLNATRRMLERTIQALRRGSANCSVLIIGPSNPDALSSDVTSGLFGNPRNWGLYLDMLATTAQAYKCAYLDLNSRWGSTGVAQGFQAANNPHPTTAGHADIAALVVSIL